ncbi:hypothetical protein CYY_005109 [Polysphondylium violaceum]|uniref:Myotubularin phosphatase domain-containing protein n=1 Tax=Polysphondylium violaceum TaxID=133409 RepID=A0A8J4V4J1_9MYCE|nr:hypothetical protein CYY_005109 [Polysphondylium violaceum]
MSGPLKGEHPAISQIINQINTKKILDFKQYLENKKNVQEFREHLTEKNKNALVNMLNCHESINSFKQSLLVDNQVFNLELAKDVINTFIIKPNTSNGSPSSHPLHIITPSTPPIKPQQPGGIGSNYIGFIDTTVYNSLKFLLDALGQSFSLCTGSVPTNNNSLSNSVGGLFQDTDIGLGLFSGLKKSGGLPTSPSVDSINAINVNPNTNQDNEESTVNNIGDDSKSNDTDMHSKITHNLFDTLDEYILYKLEPEYKKYINQKNNINSTNPSTPNTTPANNNSNNSNNNHNNYNQNIIDSPLSKSLNSQQSFEQPSTDPLSMTNQNSNNSYYQTFNYNNSSSSQNNNNNSNNSNNSNQNNNNNNVTIPITNICTLEGETMVERDGISVYYLDYQTSETIRAQLFITNFKIIFIGRTSFSEIASIPLTTIYRVDKVNNFKFDHTICIWGKNFRKIEFFINPREQAMSNASFNPEYHYMHHQQQQYNNQDFTAPIIHKLRTFAFQDPHNFFAFKYCPAKSATQDGWRVYELFKEYMRQGILGINEQKWTASMANTEYKNPTYPSMFVVPAAITDEEVIQCMNFRSKGRIPALSWISKDGIPLTRSSQPMVGITRQKCSVDEKLVDSIRLASPTNKQLYLLDARPKANAIANVAKGMGYELNYNCEIEFLGIANIHSMRDSINKLEAFCQSNNDENWLSGLDQTKWLDHLRTVLLGASRAVELMNQGHPVLLHCSDGWDRTSQISSLAMLMQDTYYRTIEGFQVLIEKEWLAFGHCFQNRVRHGDRNSYSDSQRSPIFLQFIDCVFQLMNQYYDFFEFNETYLITILDALYSCQFGTFLYNNDKERSVFQLKSKTTSLWSYINTNPLEPYLNPFFSDKERPFHLPEWKSEHIVLWKNYYLRYWRNPLKEPMDYQKIAINLKMTNNNLFKQLEELQELNRKLNLLNINNINNNSNNQNNNNSNQNNNNDIDDIISSNSSISKSGDNEITQQVVEKDII